MASGQDRSEIMSRGKKLSRRKNLLPAILGAAALAVLSAGVFWHTNFFSSPDPSRTKLMAQAESLRKIGRYKTALNKAQKALAIPRGESGPSDEVILDFMLQLASSCRELADWSCVDQIAGSLAAAPTPDFASLRRLGHALIIDEDYPLAEKALLKALALNPGDKEVLRSLGRINAARFRYKAAARFFKDAIKIAPYDYDAYLQLADIYKHLGDYPRAIQTYARAKKAAPSQARIYIEEGYALLSHGDDRKQAKKDFEQASVFAPQTSASPHHLGSFYAFTGQLDEARSFLRSALARDASDEPRWHTLNILEGIARQTGHPRLARRLAWRRLHSTIPGSKPWHEALYSITFNSGVRGDEDALALCRQGERYCRRNGGHPRSACFTILARHAEIDLAMGRREEAETFYKEAKSLRPENPDSGFSSSLDGFLRFADVAAQLGHYNEAARDYRCLASLKGVAGRPDDHLSASVLPALKGLARVYERQGRPREADKVRREARWLRSRIAPRS